MNDLENIITNGGLITYVKEWIYSKGDGKILLVLTNDPNSVQFYKVEFEDVNDYQEEEFEKLEDFELDSLIGIEDKSGTQNIIITTNSKEAQFTFKRMYCLT